MDNNEGLKPIEIEDLVENPDLLIELMQMYKKFMKNIHKPEPQKGVTH
ncbi:MAG: hypothetical protein GY714_32310 [Desulfobacterales bacterium]|nr:hypothetical protein [Desulfobacterales bacterium]